MWLYSSELEIYGRSVSEKENWFYQHNGKEVEYLSEDVQLIEREEAIGWAYYNVELGEKDYSYVSSNGLLRVTVRNFNSTFLLVKHGNYVMNCNDDPVECTARAELASIGGKMRVRLFNCKDTKDIKKALLHTCGNSLKMADIHQLPISYPDYKLKMEFYEHTHTEVRLEEDKIGKFIRQGDHLFCGSKCLTSGMAFERNGSLWFRVNRKK